MSESQQKPDVGHLVYWVRKNQVLRIGDHDVKITLKDTAPGRAQLQIEVPLGTPIKTENDLQVSNANKHGR